MSESGIEITKCSLIQLGVLDNSSATHTTTHLSVSRRLEVSRSDGRLLPVTVQITPRGKVLQTYHVSMTHQRRLLCLVLPVQGLRVFALDGPGGGNNADVVVVVVSCR